MISVIMTATFYLAIFGVFILADIISRRDYQEEKYSLGIKPENAKKLLFFGIIASVVTLFTFRTLVRMGVELEYFLSALYFYVLYNFGKRVFYPFPCCPKILALVGALVFSLVWIFYPHWLVINVTSLAVGLAILVMFGNLTFKQMFVLSASIIVYDVVMTLGVGAMDEVARGVIDTPVLVSVPEHLFTGSIALGLGDIVFPGIMVMIAFKKAREFRAPLLGYATALGYVLGAVVALCVLVSFRLTQPATLYLLPAVISVFLLVARVYGIRFSTLWKG